MRKTLHRLLSIVALGGLTAAANAQIVVWQDDFDQQPVGANSADNTYGRIAYNFAGAGVGNPRVVITNGNSSPFGNSVNYCAFIFDSTNTQPPLPLNFGWDINSIAANGYNTSTALRDYTLKFDIKVEGEGIANIGGYVGPIVYVFGHGGAGFWSSGEYYGNGAQTNINAGWFPAAGSGWAHVEMPMGTFGTANAAALNTTSAAFSFGIGAYMAGLTSINSQEIDIANVQIVMDANPPEIPPPTMNIVRTKPGLRIFAQDFSAPWNQEGFGTVNTNQSWIGVATPANPVSYSVTIDDFSTINGYTLYAQFVQNGNPGDPYGVYNGTNAFVWEINRQDTGFTTAINWKTNRPANGQNNNALPSTITTSTNGRGTWTLTFTNNTDGLVIAPDGTSIPFTLPNDPDWFAKFANPLIIDFGTAPNNPAGYGQWIDLRKVAISNVVSGTQYDDFTQDEVLNTSLWNTGFSYNNNPRSVILVTTNTPYWVNWSVPDDQFGLGTKADLGDPNIPWYTPNYYGSGVGATISTPTVMGGSRRWTLIPKDCLPTTDGNVGGPASSKAFFSLQKPAPSP